tara:strand:- start:1100 stop:1384 length:285 start_codon:yes stop_codon:yes gene_type:complete
MSWDTINTTAVDAEGAKAANAKQRQAAAELAQAYNECFASVGGKRVLEDITQRFIFNNDTSFSASNVDYEAAYHNGEAGVVKFIINQMQQAKIL